MRIYTSHDSRLRVAPGCGVGVGGRKRAFSWRVCILMQKKVEIGGLWGPPLQPGQTALLVVTDDGRGKTPMFWGVGSGRFYGSRDPPDEVLGNKS